MRVSFQIFGSIILALTFNLVVHAKEWRGITPLHSTRQDAERILGQPSRPSRATFSTYYLDEGLVQIMYASESFAKAHDCPETIPPDTVLVIYVWLKSENNLQPDITGMEEFDPAEGMGLKAYYGKKDGVVIVTGMDGKDGFLLICYMANGEDNRFCPSYYKPEKLVHIHPDY
jgi:hypothetical protein